MRQHRSAFLKIDGLMSVHAVRAAHTSLTAVPGILRAEVTRRGAWIEHDGSATREVVADALSTADLMLSDWTDERQTLPLLEEGEAG